MILPVYRACKHALSNDQYNWTSAMLKDFKKSPDADAIYFVTLSYPDFPDFNKSYVPILAEIFTILIIFGSSHNYVDCL